MGCILYELVANQPAFRDDVAVYKHYFRNQTVNFNVHNEFEEDDKDTISMTLRRMLNKEPSERPPASKLYREFSKHLEARGAKAKRPPDNNRKDPGCVDESKLQKDQGKKLSVP